MDDSPLIRVDHISKTFDSLLAVNDISFAVQRGDVLGFLGPNGAGKTTTMRMLTGYYYPDQGNVIIDGVDMADNPQAGQARIGYLPEGAPLYGEMTPRQLLRFVARIRHMEASHFGERAKWVIDQLGLKRVLDQPIETLSKGFTRRVGLAQALLHDPDILILDEPTDGLDPLQKREVRSLIRDMAQDKAIIISTHILEEVDAICTRALIIADGSLRADDTPQGLRTRYNEDNLDTLFCNLAESEAA